MRVQGRGAMLRNIGLSEIAVFAAKEKGENYPPQRQVACWTMRVTAWGLRKAALGVVCAASGARQRPERMSVRHTARGPWLSAGRTVPQEARS